MNLTDITKQIRAFADQLESTQATPSVDPYAELKAAHAAGRVIQFKPSGFSSWAEHDDPDWTAPLVCYRIKPEPPPFQLPPPPPGMQWHRTDGWQEGDLPPGTRPLVDGEAVQAQDQVKVCGRWHSDACDVDMPMRAQHLHTRTTRPLVFTHAGKSWAYHRPGDPMPCDGEARIEIVSITGKTTTDDGRMSLVARAARSNMWNHTLGWRYAEPLTREVELGPEDVPPGSVFRHKDWLPGIHRTYIEINTTGVNWAVNSALDWLELKDSHWQINRSLPLTGKWNPDAWEPCHKEAKP